jgi:hypothetical protein
MIPSQTFIEMKSTAHRHITAGILVMTMTFLGQLGAQTTGRRSLNVGAQDEKQIIENSDSISQKIPSPRGAMLRSLVLPGWGQAYNGKWFKAAVIAGAEIGLITNSIIQNRLAKNSSAESDKAFYINNRNLSYWWLSGVILFSIIDAYVDAHLFDFDESPNLSIQMNKNQSHDALATWFLRLNINL